MRLVLRVCGGLSRATGESSEDIFVEYILGDVCGCGVVGSFEDVRSWLDHYKGEYYYQDVCAVMGVDKQVVTNWTKNKNLPTDRFLKWLLSSLVSLTGSNEEEMCRSFFRMVVRLE
jgi:transcriptional regulator with XRE-family HTH domain